MRPGDRRQARHGQPSTQATAHRSWCRADAAGSIPNNFSREQKLRQNRQLALAQAGLAPGCRTHCRHSHSLQQELEANILMASLTIPLVDSLNKRIYNIYYISKCVKMEIWLSRVAGQRMNNFGAFFWSGDWRKIISVSWSHRKSVPGPWRERPAPPEWARPGPLIFIAVINILPTWDWNLAKMCKTACGTTPRRPCN